MTEQTPNERSPNEKLPNSSFAKDHPNLQVAWDSTSLGTLKECPRKYQLTMVEQWRKKSTRPALAFGLYFHEALEYFDKLKALEGYSHEEALRETLWYVLKATGTYEEGEDGTTQWVPWESDDNTRNRKTLFRAVLWYLDQFQDDPARTIVLKDGKPAVELSFRMEIPMISPEGENYLICGHIDRLVEFSDAIWVMDRKTTGTTLSANFFEQFSPDNQMSLYAVASQVIWEQPARGILIDAAQTAVGFTRFQRGFAHRTKEHLEEWLKDTMIWIAMAERFAEHGYWPMNDKSCHKWGGCPFRGICNKSPSIRDSLIATDFHREPWDPLVIRE